LRFLLTDNRGSTFLFLFIPWSSVLITITLRWGYISSMLSFWNVSKFQYNTLMLSVSRFFYLYLLDGSFFISWHFYWKLRHPLVKNDLHWTILNTDYIFIFFISLIQVSFRSVKMLSLLWRRKGVLIFLDDFHLHNTNIDIAVWPVLIVKSCRRILVFRIAHLFNYHLNGALSHSEIIRVNSCQCVLFLRFSSDFQNHLFVSV